MYALESNFLDLRKPKFRNGFEKRSDTFPSLPNHGRHVLRPIGKHRGPRMLSLDIGHLQRLSG